MQTFPTWHRAYVLLIEKIIRDQATPIAQQLATGTNDPSWNDELKSLRLPYWDWATRESEINGVPTILTDRKISVYTPDSPKHKVEIPNPLRAFTLPEDTGSVIMSGDINNPTQRPYYEPPPSSMPYTPKGYATIRHPTNDYRMSVSALNTTVQRYVSCVLRPGIFQTFTINNYDHFSNHSSVFHSGESIRQFSAYGHFASLEVVHDAVHDAIGGIGGHMSFPDIAAFDPIFFLHHCNVDRSFIMSCHDLLLLDCLPFGKLFILMNM